MLILVASIYALVFWVTTWSRPHLALMLIFALAPFQNDLSMGGPIRFSIAEINLLLALPVFVAHGCPVILRPLGIPITGYIAVCILSSMLHWRDSALVSLLQILIYLVIAVALFRALPRSPRQYRAALYGLVLVCCLISAVVVAFHSGYVLGLHKNGTGGSLACGLIVCTELWFAERDAVRKQWLLAALALIGSGLFFTLSRGAWLTAITGMTVILGMRKQFLTILRAGIIFTVLAVVCWGRLSSDSRDYATAFGRENFNIRARYESIDFALEEFWKNPITGVGVGLRKEYDATNVVLLTMAETGVTGLLALISVHLAFLRCIWKSRRFIPRSHSDFCLIAIATALIFGKMVHGMVDHYWGRGDLMMTWAAAGMALRAYDARRRTTRDSRPILPPHPLQTPQRA